MSRRHDPAADQALTRRLQAKAEAASARLDEIERTREEALAEPAPEGAPLAAETTPRRRFAWWPFGRKPARTEDKAAAIMAELEAVAAGRPAAGVEAAERRDGTGSDAASRREAAA